MTQLGHRHRVQNGSAVPCNCDMELVDISPGMLWVHDLGVVFHWPSNDTNGSIFDAGAFVPVDRRQPID
jgi:hypothetical protein